VRSVAELCFLIGGDAFSYSACNALPGSDRSPPSGPVGCSPRVIRYLPRATVELRAVLAVVSVRVVPERGRLTSFPAFFSSWHATLLGVAPSPNLTTLVRFSPASALFSRWCSCLGVIGGTHGARSPGSASKPRYPVSSPARKRKSRRPSLGSCLSRCLRGSLCRSDKERSGDGQGPDHACSPCVGNQIRGQRYPRRVSPWSLARHNN